MATLGVRPAHLTAPTSGISRKKGRLVIPGGRCRPRDVQEWGRRIRRLSPAPARVPMLPSTGCGWKTSWGLPAASLRALPRAGHPDGVPQGVAGARRLSSTKLAGIQNGIARSSRWSARVPVGGHDVQVTDCDYFVESISRSTAELDMGRTGGRWRSAATTGARGHVRRPEQDGPAVPWTGSVRIQHRLHRGRVDVVTEELRASPPTIPDSRTTSFRSSAARFGSLRSAPHLTALPRS